MTDTVHQGVLINDTTDPAEWVKLLGHIRQNMHSTWDVYHHVVFFTNKFDKDNLISAVDQMADQTVAAQYRRQYRTMSNLFHAVNRTNKDGTCLVFFDQIRAPLPNLVNTGNDSTTTTTMTTTTINIPPDMTNVACVVVFYRDRKMWIFDPLLREDRSAPLIPLAQEYVRCLIQEFEVPEIKVMRGGGGGTGSGQELAASWLWQNSLTYKSNGHDPTDWKVLYPWRLVN